ncbi:hypothetical protein FOZ60_008113 [Perkinsus olseni]|uniref:Uncharacterized protein n=1 Tax=Perkinsus olseni TaxID=32597 RepID=A0A7J6NK28_PEROL|nr:hypothetical protein FOZ60_008113 [Perkinsus olseni]
MIEPNPLLHFLAVAPNMVMDHRLFLRSPHLVRKMHTTNKHDLPYATTVIAVGMLMSLYLSGCYSYGGINVRRFGVGSPEATAAAADHVASTVHEDRCYAEVFGMQVAFTSTQAAVDDGVYQGVEIKCGNHLVNLNDVEGYPLMKDNLLRNNNNSRLNTTLDDDSIQVLTVPTTVMMYIIHCIMVTTRWHQFLLHKCIISSR